MPPVSEAQRRAMFAAAEGHGTLGIPKKVGEEFVGKARDMAPSKWATLKRLFTEWIDEEEAEPEHQGQDAEPAGRAASVAFFSPTGKVLLLKRAATEENWPDTWALPGGKADGDEDIADCARRECREEIGDCELGAMAEIDRNRTPRNWEHTTYAVKTADEFEPKLNSEHSEYRWAPLDDLPEPLHPGVAATLRTMAADEATNDWRREHGYEEDLPAFKAGRYGLQPGITANDMALDRNSARSYDADGRLHVERSSISKSNICEYFGREIPGSETLGLDPARKYRLLRDPVELERAADTFNRLPILKRHVPVTADTHDPALVIGATGENATFEAPYLRNSLVFWPQAAIDDIESGNQKQLSSAYRYRADMTPGSYQNEPYDGVMRDIVGNHVALVTEGRAGPDVMVGDSMPAQEKPMKTSLSSLLAARAIKRLNLTGVSREALAIAMDEEMEGEDELDPNSGLPAGMRKPAEDEETDEEKAERMRNRACDAAMGLACAKDEDPETEEERKERMERREAGDKRAKDARARHGRDESEEERKDREEKDRAEDRRARDARRAKDAKRGKDEEPDMVDKKAMDAAIESAVQSERHRQRDIREAEQAVRPYVGEIAMACDSAEEVYRQALGILGVPEAKTIHASALPTVLRMQAKPGARPSEHRAGAIAMDASAVDGFNKRFPDAARITSA